MSAAKLKPPFDDDGKNLRENAVWMSAQVWKSFGRDQGLPGFHGFFSLSALIRGPLFFVRAALSRASPAIGAGGQFFALHFGHFAKLTSRH